MCIYRIVRIVSEQKKKLCRNLVWGCMICIFMYCTALEILRKVSNFWVTITNLHFNFDFSLHTYFCVGNKRNFMSSAYRGIDGGGVYSHSRCLKNFVLLFPKNQFTKRNVIMSNIGENLMKKIIQVTGALLYTKTLWVYVYLYINYRYFTDEYS